MTADNIHTKHALTDTPFDEMIDDGDAFDMDDDTADDQDADSYDGERTYTVQASDIGVRLDKLGSTVFDGFSRANIQKFIDNGELLVNGMIVKPKYAVKSGDVLTLTASLENHSEDLPENITIDVIYEDDAVIVINKPAGLVVHPGAGNRTGTLVNALLYHYPDVAHLPRAGLVHRIDKDTTGLLVVARTKTAQLDLIDQLKDKSVYRLYQCIALGAPHDIMRHARIDAPIGRHSTQRTKMAVKDTGKPAVTHILKAVALHERYSLCDVQLETGRTHQIRVHLSHVGHPLVGDKVYGTSPRAGLTDTQRQAVTNFPRQALHAHTLGFIHPVSGESMKFHAPLPADFCALMDVFAD